MENFLQQHRTKIETLLQVKSLGADAESLPKPVKTSPHVVLLCRRCFPHFCSREDVFQPCG